MIPGILSGIARCIVVVVLIRLGWKYWAVVFADVCSFTWSAWRPFDS